MPLETGTTIADLNENWPLGSDNVSQGDDHLRLIKSVLKSQFPNLDCPVTATCDDLNNAGKSGMPTVTTYKTAAAAQTHTLQPGTSWVRLIVTGGGGGGYSVNGGYGGFGGCTAIRVILTGTATDLTFTVGEGGAIGGDGTDSSVTVNDATPTTITAQGGPRGPLSQDATNPGHAATGGDINLQGGGPDTNLSAGGGGASYWGTGWAIDGANVSPDIPGVGGRGGSSTQGGRPGRDGCVFIEEY